MLQQKSVNVTMQAKVTSSRQKLALKRALAEKTDLQKQLSKFSADVKSVMREKKQAEIAARREAKRAAQAAQEAEQEAAVALTKADAQDDEAARAAAEKKVALLTASNRKAAVRITELQEDLDIRLRVETNFKSNLQQSNASLTAATKKALLLQKREEALQQVSEREAARRREAEDERAQIEGQSELLKQQVEKLQEQLKTKADELEQVKQSKKQAEANENEYFDSMTSLQSAKDDLSQQYSESQKALAAAQKKADDLEKTNEYLRGEQQSQDQAGQAAMSDYLKGIEQMKMEQEKQAGTIAQQAAEAQELKQAAKDLWNELTPAQRKSMQ